MLALELHHGPIGILEKQGLVMGLWVIGRPSLEKTTEPTLSHSLLHFPAMNYLCSTVHSYHDASCGYRIIWQWTEPQTL